ncbi:MAG: phasin family protein [Hyphomicrobiales bacterium]
MTGTRYAETSSETENELAVMMSEPIMAACKAYFVDMPLTLTNEALRFVAHRFEEQARLLSELSACKTPSEAAQAQLAFFRGAVGDYGKEAKTLAHRARKAIS